MTEANATLLVAHNDECCEAKALAALHNLRHAIDVDELIDELTVALFPTAPVAATAAFAFTCHGVFQSLKDLRLCRCVRSIPKS